MKSRTDRRSEPCTGWGGVPREIYGVMVITALLTFGSLMTAYQLFFSRSLYA